MILKSFLLKIFILLAIGAFAQPTTKRFWLGATSGANFSSNTSWSASSGGAPTSYVSNVNTHYTFDGAGTPGLTYTINADDLNIGYITVTNNTTVILQRGTSSGTTNINTSGIDIDAGSKLVWQNTGTGGTLALIYQTTYTNGFIDGELEVLSGAARANFNPSGISTGFTNIVSSTGVIRLTGTVATNSSTITSTPTTLNLQANSNVYINQNGGASFTANCSPTSTIHITGPNQTNSTAGRLSSSLAAGNIIVNIPNNTVNVPLFFGGGWSTNNITIENAGTGKVGFYNSGTASSGTISGNLTLSSMGGTTSPYFQYLLTGSTTTNTLVNILGNLDVQAGTTLDLGTNGTGSALGQLGVRGNVTVAGTLTETGGSSATSGYPITLNGTATSQNINFTGATLNNDVSIVLNNPLGFDMTGDLTMSSSANSRFTFSNGILNGAGTLTALSNATTAITGGSPTSFFNGGKIRRSMDAAGSTYFFAVGKANKFAPVKIFPTTANPSDFTVEYFSNQFTTLTCTNTALTASYQEYWNINRNAGADPVDLSLLTINKAGSGMIDPNNQAYQVGRYNGATWDDFPNGSTNSTYLTTGLEVTTSAYAGAFSPFTIVAPLTSLPVTLARFTGQVTGATNTLDWTTATEANNAKFIVERSVNGTSFNPIGEVASRATNGNSNVSINYSFVDVNPVSGKSFYRLRQVDRGGAEKLSHIVTLRRGGGKLEITDVRPNPTSNFVYFNLLGENNTSKLLVVRDMNGKEVLRKQYNNAGSNSLNLANLSSGIYTLEAIDNKTAERAIYKIVKQ
jgi:fibronectin-binding autotransporter adhesin